MQQNPSSFVERLLKQLCFFWKMKRKLKRMRKIFRYRFHVIQEIIKTEENYVRDLRIVLNVKNSLAGQLLSNIDQLIFQNVDEICKVNEDWLEALRKNAHGCTMKTPQQKIFEGLLAYAEKFNCYFDYCNGYQTSTKIIEQEIKVNNNSSLIDALKANAANFRQMQIEDFLVMPIQRLPKYNLLLKDLQKHTPEFHPDRKAIDELLEKFMQLNEENNKNMDKFQSNLQVKSISQQLNEPKIYDLKRYFYSSESRQVIEHEQELSVRAYFFNDVVVLTMQDQNTERIFKILNLDETSQVKEQEDTIYYKHLYQLVGKNGTIQFIADSQKSKRTHVDQLKGICDYIRKQSDKNVNLIQVRVLGTQERDIQSLQKYTVYVTEIQIEKIFLKAYFRYSEIVKLIEKFHHIYKDVNLKHLSTSTWISNHSTKVIEQRAIAIENVLQTILQQEETKRTSEVLEYLSLPLNFYQLPELNTKLDMQLMRKFQGEERKQHNTSTTQAIRRALEKQSEDKINITDICKTLDKRLHRIQHQWVDSYEVEIDFMDGKQIQLTITHQTRVAELVELLANEIELRAFEDFRLFWVDSYGVRKVIDDDEIVYKYISREQQEGILTKSIRRIEKVLYTQKKQHLLFGKHIFLSSMSEQEDCKHDPVRMRLVVSQIFFDITQQRVSMKLQDYVVFTSLYFKIQKVQLKQEEIQKFLPAKIYREQPPELWLELVKTHITKISKELIPFMNGEITEASLSSQMVLKSLSVNPVFSMATYNVDMVWSKHQRNHSSVTLGVGYQHLSMMSSEDMSEFAQIEYRDIEKVKSLPNKLILMAKGNEEIKLHTFSSYEIKMLIEFYQNIQDELK